MFLTNYNCLRKRLIMLISLNSSYLCSMSGTLIIFQFFRTILKIRSSNVSFFTRLLCIFAIFNIIILNFAKRTSFSNIGTNVLILKQNLRLLLPKPKMVCLLFIFWVLGLSITGFVIKIVVTLILGLIFIIFIISFTFKLYILINVFIQKIFRNALYMLFRLFSMSIFYCFVWVFFTIILLICIFVNLLPVFGNIVNLFYILSSCSESVNVDTDITHTARQESNIISFDM